MNTNKTIRISGESEHTHIRIKHTDIGIKDEDIFLWEVNYILQGKVMATSTEE
jgi:hypothetical protein